MIKFKKFISLSVMVITVCSCSQVLQTVKLDLHTEDNLKQENFSVVEKTLTLSEAKRQNTSPYKRNVLQGGKGQNARTVSETVAIISKLPKNEYLDEYKLGRGDSLLFTRLVENKYSEIKNKSRWPNAKKFYKYKLGIGDTLALTLLNDEDPLNGGMQNFGSNSTGESGSNTSTVIIPRDRENTITAQGRIGSDGSVLLLKVGRLEANRKTLNELRSEVRNILIRNGVSPRFQLEIVQFQSQRAYLTINQLISNKSSRMIILNDQKLHLRDLLASNGVTSSPGVSTFVILQRSGNEFRLKLRDVFSKNSPEVIIADRDHIFVEDVSSEIISSEAIVGTDGYVVLAGVGKIKTAGLSLNELRSKISRLIDKLPESQNAFQVEVTKFSSQKALISLSGSFSGNTTTGGRGIVTISNNSIALDEILIEYGLSLDTSVVTRITLRRRGRSYRFTLDELLNSTTERVYLEPDDRITVETLPYKKNKVFILGAVTPKILNINPIERETLADILFTEDGVLSSSKAKRSEIYLLRGTGPVYALHLNAQNPTRLIIADTLELRPNDILYVAEQPIISFNRTLLTIAPLRVLLRDIQDNNLP